MKPIPFRSRVVTWLSRLRFPRLFMAAVVLFVLDALIPDVIPFADEILLALIAAMLASLKRKRDDRPGG